MQRHGVADVEVIKESDPLDASAHDLDPLVTEHELAAHEIESAALDGREVAVQGHDAAPTNSTVIEHLERDVCLPGAQETEPGIHGEDVEVVLGHATIPRGRDERRKASARSMREALVERCSEY